jgi:hypothetical protein
VVIAIRDGPKTFNLSFYRDSRWFKNLKPFFLSRFAMTIRVPFFFRFGTFQNGKITKITIEAIGKNPICKISRLTDPFLSRLAFQTSEAALATFVSFRELS